MKNEKLATWFKENERTTVTAIATLSNVLGNAVGFLYGPYLVKYTNLPTLLVVQAVGAGKINK